MKKIVIPALVSGAAALAASMLFSQILSALFPSIGREYMKPNLFRPWNDPLMSLYFAYPFVLATVLAWAWDKSKKLFHGSVLNRGARAGFAYWLIASLPGMFITYSSFKVSFLMVLSWSTVGLLEVIVAALVLVKINP